MANDPPLSDCPVFKRKDAKKFKFESFFAQFWDSRVTDHIEHKTFGLAINRDYLSTVFTSDHPCPEYIVYSQYTGGLWRNQHQKQKMARPINREGTYFML